MAELHKNDRIQLEITGMTAEGSGVGRSGEMVVFVAAAVPGDRIVAHIIKVSKTYAVGKIHQIITPSADRIASDCPVSDRCGGCAFRQMTYEAELKVKWERVRDALARIGRLDLIPEPILGAEKTMGYRNKAQYPVGEQDGKAVAGFYAPRSHRIVPCQTCVLQPEEFARGMGACLKWMKDCRISSYHEETGEGVVRHLYFRKAFGTGQVLACVVVNDTTVPRGEYLVDCLRDALPQLTGVTANFNRKKTNVVLGDRDQVLWGQGTITDLLCGLRFTISPRSFYQVNHSQTQRLYALAKEYAKLSGRERVLDLYCGAGTIGLSMADRAKEVIGVEVVAPAVENARENARLNRIENARFYCEDASSAAKRLAQEGCCPDVVVIDPPRKGCAPEVIESIVSMRPERIVYVSCDPATLARDLALFQKLGYPPVKATPVDLFPRTGHCEVCVELCRKEEVGNINL